MSRFANAVLDRVDRVLAACGGGLVLVVGDTVRATVEAWRHRGVSARAGALAEIAADAPMELIWLEGVLESLAEPELATLLDQARRQSPRALIVTVDGPRDDWERRILRRGWRKHPLYQQVVDYTALDSETGALLLFEPVPATVSWGAALDDLAPGRDLHMDMLREAGRRADAHVARYVWALRYVRPGDRVLDVACGLGYGSRVLTDGTLAESVLGIDVDETAIRYAAEHYGAARARLSFDARDLTTMGALPAASFDVIVSFETVEHLADPERFLADCRRLLTPGGRFLCSVPNEWLNEHGVDPNPHHLHVFNRERLETLCRGHFLLEDVYGQTAGGGMKLPGAGRALWQASSPGDDAEWWLAASMTPPFGAVADPVGTRWQPEPSADPPTLIAFERDYEHPWLVRALVSMGLRTESPALLEHLASRALAESSAASADHGAALCVRAYRQLSGPDGITRETEDAIDRYCEAPAANPHVARWHISLRYVQGLAHLRAGDHAAATSALSRCVKADPLIFSPLLATKSVSACWLLGWMAAQRRDLKSAARWWRAGVHHAERALHRPWSELMVDRDRPVLFGLREAALLADLASQCAAGLHLLPHVVDRPGILWSQITDSMDQRLDRQGRALGELAEACAALQASAADAWRRCQAAEAEVVELRLRAAAPWLFEETTTRHESPRVAIFGTGLGGRQAMARLRNRGVRIDCFADNDRSRWHQQIDDVTVVDPGTLRARGVDFIAVASARGRDAIFAQLTALGYRPGSDFEAVA